MPAVVEAFDGEANVVHNPGNAQHSGYGLENLEDWLGDTDWDVIHFNHGLHDLKYVDENGKNVKSEAEGHIQISLDRYRHNMEAIVVRLKETGAHLIFATTTPYPDSVAGPLRKPGYAAMYNEVAVDVMLKHNIAVNDLYAFALPRLASIQRPNNVHFTEKGSEVLGKEVVRHIRQALGKK